MALAIQSDGRDHPVGRGGGEGVTVLGNYTKVELAAQEYARLCESHRKAWYAIADLEARISEIRNEATAIEAKRDEALAYLTVVARTENGVPVVRNLEEPTVLVGAGAKE